MHMNTQKNRDGLSVLEFVGCLMALVGGVWLGAIYLGIDVQHVAYVALSESKLMEQVPEKWRPVEPESEKGPTHAELAASVRNELVSLRQEITSLRETHQATAAAIPAVEPGDSSDAAPHEAAGNSEQASLEYWKRLSEIVHSQATLQFDAESAATQGNATKVAALKGRVSRMSATAIHALSTKNVDPSLVTFGREIADWYESGATLYDEAVQIWGSPSQGQGSSPLTKEWQQAHAQFGNEGQVLRGRAATVGEALTQQFGVEFPPIAGL
jgi:hypothetical protein